MYSKAALCSLAILIFTPNVFAHGGVTIDRDQCVFRAEGHTIHFTAYQPIETQQEEHCRKIPTISKTLMVLDFIDESLRNIPIEIRVERKQDEQFVEYLAAKAERYTSGSANLELIGITEGQYRVSVGLLESEKHNHQEREHKTGSFDFFVEDISKRGEVGFLNKNVWVFYLAAFGLFVYLLARKYMGKA